MKSCQKLPPCPADPIPDGSKDGHTAGQGWLIRNNGNIFNKKEKKKVVAQY